MAQLIHVLMPQLGETVTEGTITRWFCAPGDTVAEDEDLFEVSTDKVDTTVPSDTAGTIVELLVAEGDTVPIGAALATIRPAAASTTSDDVSGDDATGVAATPSNGDGSGTGTGTGQRTVSPPRSSTDGDSFLSPVVRRLIAEHQLDIRSLHGSGRDGRITRADVLAAAGQAGAVLTRDRPAAAPVAPVHGTAGAMPTAPALDPTDEVVPLTSIRRRIAEHMTRSIATSAHTLVVMEADYGAIEAVRRDAHLSYLPFVARAVTLTIPAFPHVNARLTPDDLVVHHRVHLGVAVDLDFQGLIVPVVRDAHDLGLVPLAAALRDRAERAHADALRPDDVSGGTFTITNAGGYGTFLTAPIIHQPQVAILATDGVRMRPVAVALDDGTYGVAVHPIGHLALSFDHRAFDGAYASAFLAHVVALIEDHDWRAELDPDGTTRLDHQGKDRA